MLKGTKQMVSENESCQKKKIKEIKQPTLQRNVLSIFFFFYQGSK